MQYFFLFWIQYLLSIDIFSCMVKEKQGIHTIFFSSLPDAEVASRCGSLTYCPYTKVIQYSFYSVFLFIWGYCIYYSFPMRAIMVPVIVRIIPIIQNLITIVSSCHPIASKWWWKGAILNIFLPFRSFLDVIWIMTDSVSRIKILLITMKASIVSVMIAITASVAPSASDPVSHINIFAGWILYHKNPIRTPTMMRQKADKINIPCI